MSFDIQRYLRSLSRFGIKPGLERIQGLLERLGRPERAFPAVHIGGTNGKGSIAAMTASVLEEAGYRVGMYTSPHLSCYHERIRVGGLPISDEALQAAFREVAAAASEVSRRLGSDPTEFDVGTAAAFWHFARAGVDIAVVEVGLGGRWDSTNVVESRVSALGPISLDHTSILGPDLPSIAREKAGIFRPGIPAVVAPQAPEAAAALAQAAEEAGAPLVWVRETEEDPASSFPAAAGAGEESTWYRVSAWGEWGGRFDARTPLRAYQDLEISLLGRHQLQNAAVALAIIDRLTGSGWSIPEDALRRGLSRTTWPGRLERIPQDPEVLLDGVHNPAGARALREALLDLFPGRPIVFVMAILGEKDAAGILEPLLPLGREVIFTRPASARVPPADPERLSSLATSHGVSVRSAEPAAEALALARKAAGKDGLVVVCGSLYLVGEVRAGLLAPTSTA